MQVTAWKSPETGELFASEAQFRAHMSELESVKLEKARTLPFRRVHWNLGSLPRFLVESYRETVQLLVETGELPEAALKRQLIKVDGVEALSLNQEEPGEISEAFVCGTLLFTYEGDILTGALDDALVAFPLLAGDNRAASAEVPLPEPEQGRRTVAWKVRIPVPGVPALAAKYETFVKRHALRLDYEWRERTLRGELAALEADAGAVHKRISELTSELERLRARQREIEINQTHQLETLKSVRAYADAREFLHVPNSKSS